MEVKGLDKLLNVLDSSIKGFDVEIPKMLSRVSSKLIRKVKLKTPVDSGVLRKSWHSKKDGDLARVVYNNIKYASHVESDTEQEVESLLLMEFICLKNQ